MPEAGRRLLVPWFVETFRWNALRPHLPFQLVITHEVPAWQARICRSCDAWQLPEGSSQPKTWAGLDDFDLLPRLFDFSVWRSILGQRFANQFGPPLCPHGDRLRLSGHDDEREDTNRVCRQLCVAHATPDVRAPDTPAPDTRRCPYCDAERPLAPQSG